MSLPLPNFYNPENADNTFYNPKGTEIRDAAFAYAKLHGIRPCASDKANVTVLPIDMQRDFCHRDGPLFVGGRSGDGAVEDSKRACSFIYRNLDVISHIVPTMDTHFAWQIFLASMWMDRDEQPCQPWTSISIKDIQSGNFVPTLAMAGIICDGNIRWLQDYVAHYCQTLADTGKYELFLWPEHTMLGSLGHALTGVMHEASMFHAYARASQSVREIKGGNPLTENYSVLSPEVLKRHDKKTLAQKNTQFIDRLIASDAVIVLGQAGSHCLKSTVEDLIFEIKAVNPELVKRVYLVEDCTSAVVIPGVHDYTDEMMASFDEFRKEGMNVVKSTDDIKSWPGFPA